MNETHRLISTVDHVVEPPQLWAQHLSNSKWYGSVPHVERESDGTDSWVINGRKIRLSEVTGIGALMPDRGNSAQRWAEVPEGAYLPTARLKAMDRDGVKCSVLYPTVAGFSGENIGAIDDPDLELACVRTYNDWLIDEWAACSDRLIPQCILPLSSIDAAVRELRRAIENGHRGVVFPAVPMHVRKAPHINGSEYDPIWAACQELAVPLCFHAGSSQRLEYPIAPGYSPELAAAMQAVIRPASAVFDFVNLLFSTILLRFPNLKVIFAESSIGWGTFLLEYADHQYDQDHCDYELKPSEMFKRQCYLTSWYEPIKKDRASISPDNVLWATNFPLANSSWPDTSAFIEKCLSELTDEQQNQILWGNAAKLYKVET